MAGGGSSYSNPPTSRKRVDAGTDSGSSASSTASLVRAKDGSAFARCDECNRNVPVALISFHNCSLDARIKMTLESQVVEKPAEEKKKAPQKRKAKSTESKAKREKKTRNSNGLKRPPTAFFVFMSEFRKSYKEANPDCKSVASVAKEGGEKWNSLTDEEKKPYKDQAAELKAKYEEALKANDDAAIDIEDDEGDSFRQGRERRQ